MKVVRNIKWSAGRRILKRESEPARHRQGFNFRSAERIGLLYLDTDEQQFNRVRHFARKLKEDFGVKNVRALGFVDDLSKRLPVWQAQKLEFEYFTRDDLNWYFRPVQRVESFTKEAFDILIDLSDGHQVPLAFIFKENMAKMKVGRKRSIVAPWCDLMIDLPEGSSMEAFIAQVSTYLSNTQVK